MRKYWKKKLKSSNVSTSFVENDLFWLFEIPWRVIVFTSDFDHFLCANTSSTSLCFATIFWVFGTHVVPRILASSGFIKYMVVMNELQIAMAWHCKRGLLVKICRKEWKEHISYVCRMVDNCKRIETKEVFRLTWSKIILFKVICHLQIFIECF